MAEAIVGCDHRFCNNDADETVANLLLTPGKSHPECNVNRSEELLS